MLQYLLAFFILLRIMAHMLPHTVLARLRQLGEEREQRGQNQGNNGGQDQGAAAAAPNDEKKEAFKSEGFEPSPVDIVVTRIMLSRGLKLPPDICDAIFDFAEYWAHSSNDIDFREEHREVLRIAGGSPSENKFLLRSFPVGLTGIYEKKDLAEELAYCTNESKPQPLGREHEPIHFAKLADYPAPVLVSPVRKVVFTIRSRDQGWCSEREHGVYEKSWTWFEAGLERFDADQSCESQCTYDVRYKARDSVAPALPVCALRPLHPAFAPLSEGDDEYTYEFPMLPDDKWTIQRNRTAKREVADHVVTWSWLDDIAPESEESMELEEKGRGRATGDGSFVRDLKMGDVVTMWAKARFPAWVNHIERVKIDIYWAV